MSTALRGVLRALPEHILRGTLRPQARLTAFVRYTDHVGVEESLPAYSGAYTVTPAPAAQILPTEGRKMTGDVTVLAIPFYEVSNGSGGITAIIGG